MTTVNSPFSATAFVGKTALITGAAGGIGGAIARILSSGGAKLILTDLHRESLEELATDLVPDRTVLISGDLCSRDLQEKLVACAESEGGIDFLIPTAGIYPESSLGNITDEAWEKVFAVNVTAVFSLTRGIAPHLKDYASVVNFGSIAGARGSADHSHYAATKGAISSFSQSLAREWGARGIRVNTIAPGIINTSMTDDLMSSSGETILSNTPLHRLGTAGEVAATAAFLCTDLAAFITGETIHVNGGFHMA